MSTLIVLKLNEDVVLATDSLTYDIQGHAVSRSQQKIFEIAPGLFYGSTGRTSLAIQSANIAAALSRTRAWPRNLYRFVEELNAATMTYLVLEANKRLAEQSQPVADRLAQEATASGKIPFYIYVMAGVSEEGVPGFVVCQFKLKNGEVCREMAGNFEPTTNDEPVHYMTGVLPVELINNPIAWADGLTTAAERFVDYQRLFAPAYIGGKTQMARIDKLGARWVYEPVELHPRGPAMRSDGSGGVRVAVGGIDNDLLADLAVSSAKIADGAVITAKIPNLSIITSKLAAYAVDSTKLAALAVQAGNLADSAVTATKIANLAVGTAAIANLAVGNAQIANAAITNSKIGNLAVGTANIADGNITTAKIANLAVTNAQIGNLDVAKLTAGTMKVNGILAGIWLEDIGNSYNYTQINPTSIRIQHQFGSNPYRYGGVRIEAVDNSTIGHAGGLLDVQTDGYSGFTVNGADRTVTIAFGWSLLMEGSLAQTTLISYTKPGGATGTMQFRNGLLTSFT